MDDGSARTVRLPRSTWVRPLYCFGFFWFVTTEGEVFRVSPYGSRDNGPWAILPASSFALTPFSIYSGGANTLEEPRLVVMNGNEVLGVSLLKRDRVRLLYAPPADYLLLCNIQEDHYLAIAVWSRGVAFLEEYRGRPMLVMKPFEQEPIRVGIDDSGPVLGPVARGESICFCTRRRLYWYETSSEKLTFREFPEQFQVFARRPLLQAANVAPGIVPLAIEVTSNMKRAYVLGEIGGTAYYLEAVLALDIRFEPPKQLPAGAFIDTNRNGTLVVNASKEVWELTAQGKRSQPCAELLKGSMPACTGGGQIFGFRESPFGPAMWGNGGSHVLTGDLENCDENTTMGWIMHTTGPSLVMRKNRELHLLWWGARESENGVELHG
jgi:hypothetical protein